MRFKPLKSELQIVVGDFVFMLFSQSILPSPIFFSCYPLLFFIFLFCSFNFFPVLNFFSIPTWMVLWWNYGKNFDCLKKKKVLGLLVLRKWLFPNNKPNLVLCSNYKLTKTIRRLLNLLFNNFGAVLMV